MNQDFIHRASAWLNREIQNTKLNESIKICSIDLIEHDLQERQFISISSNIKQALFVKDTSSEFSKNGSQTIRATNGYFIQPALNLNNANFLKHSDAVFNFIITDANQRGYIELVISSKQKIKNNQVAEAHIFFKRLQSIYYEETKKIKKYDLQNHADYLLQHKKDIQQDFTYSSNFNLNFSWHIDKDRKLNTKQLQVIIGLHLAYNNNELLSYFNIDKSVKKRCIDSIKSVLNLEKTANNSEILKIARRLNIINTLEQNLNL